MMCNLVPGFNLQILLHLLSTFQHLFRFTKLISRWLSLPSGFSGLFAPQVLLYLIPHKQWLFTCPHVLIIVVFRQGSTVEQALLIAVGALFSPLKNTLMYMGH